MKPHLSAFLILMLIVTVFGISHDSSAFAARPPAAWTLASAAGLVDSIPETTGISGAEDLLAEVRFIGEQIAADGRHYPPGANLHNSTNNHFLYPYGRSLFAVVQLLPFLPGELGDASSTRDGVAAYLRGELETYLLDPAYYPIEESGSIGYRQGAQEYRGWAPAVLQPGEAAVDESPWWNPSPAWNWGSSGVAQGRAGMAWDNNWRAPAQYSRWEGLLAIWAYAHYSGDWALVRDNWATIQSIRAGAPTNPVKPVNPSAAATNSWLMGLTAYARLARGVGDGATEATTLTQLQGVLDARTAQGLGGVKHFEYTSLSGLLWIEGWDEWTAEFGRWLREAFGAEALSSQIATLVGDERIYLWYESDMSHAHSGENQQQASWISFPLYQAYTAALATPGTDGSWTYDASARAFLRDVLPQPVVSRVTPYHRDAYYLQNLVALLRAHGTTRWVDAPANVAADAPVPPGLAQTRSSSKVADVPRIPGFGAGKGKSFSSPPHSGEGSAIKVSAADDVPQGADDWPQFMHDAANSGFSRDGLRAGPVSDPQGYAVENLQLLWKKNVGAGTHGRAQPVVVDNVLYQGFLDGRFLALDGDTGATLWRVQTGGPISGAAAVAQGRVYFASWDGRIYACDAATGAEVWTFDTQDLDVSPPVLRGRVKAPLLLAEGTLYVGAGNRRFYALDAATGALKWRYSTPANIESSAVYARGRVIFMTEVGYDPTLPAGQQVALFGIALNAADGTLAWKVPVPGERAGASYPVVAGAYVLLMGEPADQSPYGIWITDAWEYFGENSYVSSYGGADEVLRLAAEMLQRYPQHRASLVVEIDSGQERRFDIPGMSAPQPLPLGSVYNNWIIPVVHDGQFLFSQYHGLWLADPATGTIRHRFDRDVWMDGVRQEEYHQFVGGKDYLFFSGTGGELYWIDLTAPQGSPETLLDPAWGHFPEAWADPPSAPTSYLPGQGNGYVEASGYAVPYGGRLYVAAVPGWVYAFQGQYEAGAPDLTEVGKVADPSAALFNEAVTFTISFTGGGGETVVTDPLPELLRYEQAEGTCAGSVTYQPADHTVRYNGTPALGAACEIEIVTRVDTTQSTAVTNVARVETGSATLQIAHATVTLNGRQTFLPVITR